MCVAKQAGQSATGSGAQGCMAFGSRLTLVKPNMNPEIRAPTRHDFVDLPRLLCRTGSCIDTAGASPWIHSDVSPGIAAALPVAARACACKISLHYMTRN